ncbi:DUF6777 domain-containing protein [Streptomyces sp. Da 82-17]|uniref:DUF6777 domain-containing protein n=1 Tax=Streptomyces sp. Da 82-17 TaxID=3377116 RepID=UPI0038D509ED
MATITAVIVAAVALVVYLTRPDGGAGGGGTASGEIFLEPAASRGEAPFTGSTARKPAESPTPTATPTPTPSETEDTGGRATYSGATPGLYGGSRSAASCDVEKQIKFLGGEPAKAEAFAGVQGVKAGELPSYLRSLTPVQLRADTRVTNHGFADGKATRYQAVLQSGTAVLVDSRGVPRVRCACGNPLLPPVAVKTTPKETGERWPTYQPSKVVVVQEAPKVVNEFVLIDPENGDWFKRDKGDSDGDSDEPTTPPTSDSPTPPTDSPTDSPTTETPPASPSEPPTSEAPESPPPDTPAPSPPQEQPDAPSPPAETPGSAATLPSARTPAAPTS